MHLTFVSTEIQYCFEGASESTLSRTQQIRSSVAEVFFRCRTFGTHKVREAIDFCVNLKLHHRVHCFDMQIHIACRSRFSHGSPFLPASLLSDASDTVLQNRRCRCVRACVSYAYEFVTACRRICILFRFFSHFALHTECERSTFTPDLECSLYTNDAERAHMGRTTKKQKKSTTAWCGSICTAFICSMIHEGRLRTENKMQTFRYSLKWVFFCRSASSHPAAGQWENATISNGHQATVELSHI